VHILCFYLDPNQEAEQGGKSSTKPQGDYYQIDIAATDPEEYDKVGTFMVWLDNTKDFVKLYISYSRECMLDIITKVT
jgi:hypothetical protein